MSLRIAAVIAAVFGMLAAAHGQSVIELRASARLAPGATATLGQVAALSGPEAEAMADVAVPVSAPSGSLGLDEVRAAIEAHGRVNWGRITLRGSTCALRAPLPEEKHAPEVKGASAAPAPVSFEGTVRAAAIARIAQLLGVATDDLRVTFAPEDDEVLNLSTAGRTLDIHAAGASDRLPLAIAVYAGDRTVASRTVRTSVQVRRTVLVAATGLRRGEVVNADDVREESRWMGPTGRPAQREEVIGSAAQARVNPGEVVMQDDVAPSVVVNKGDIVAVRCVSASIVLATRGRAMSPGRTGDLIQFQALDSKRTFFARIDGKARAVVTAGDAVPVDSAAAVRTASLPVRGQRVAPPAGALETLR